MAQLDAWKEMMQHRSGLKLSWMLMFMMALSGCQKPHPDEKNDNSAESQPKPAPTNDSYPVAKDVYQFLLQAEPLLAVKTTDFQKQIYTPIRQLLTRWQLEVKQGDSAIGDQYTICRGALLSLDEWTRSVESDSSSQADKKEIFENQKQICGKRLLSHQ